MKEQLLEYLFKKSPVALSYHKAIFNKDGIPYDCEFLDVNNIYESMIGLKDYEVIGKRYSEIFKIENNIGDEWEKAFKEAIINDKTVVIDLYNKAVAKWIRITIFILDNEHFACIFNDVSKEYMKEKEIEGIFKVNIDMLCVIDENLNFLKVNREFEKVLGYTAEEFEGKSFLSLVDKEDLPKTVNIIRNLNELEPISGFVNRISSKIGGYRYLEWYIQMNYQYIYASARDVTEKIQQEANLKKALTKDEEVGLLSIDFFNKRIAEEIERADRYNDPLSMIMLTLDNFKTSKLGSSVKEEVVRETAKIANSVIRKYDILVKIDDEKFVLLMPKTNKSGAIIVAEKVRKALNENIHPIIGQFMASFGVSERIKAESLKQWQERLNKLLISAQEQGENSILATKFEDENEIKAKRIQWNNEWNSGNEDVDKEHKELLELLNDLINAAIMEMDFEKSLEKLDILIDRTIKHFDREEEILKSIGYKDYDKHSKIHKNLIGKVFQLKQCYENRELNPSAFFSFLADDVVIGHLINEDMQFFNLLNIS
ncbi:hemerythrin domain-containing protein [Clostridium sp. C2-6-12]|uniref:hemerythrin domain-containing protein n=1 Tax=Clostridium sp. C2-6-12 TaxID=2698832 RepID=UPI001368ECB9|nr:hemerythrin domain-containing protein [Clostridium sp. C2-6-12]